MLHTVGWWQPKAARKIYRNRPYRKHQCRLYCFSCQRYVTVNEFENWKRTRAALLRSLCNNWHKIRSCNSIKVIERKMSCWWSCYSKFERLLKEMFSAAYEICKLVKKPAKRNTRLDQMQNSTKNESKGIQTDF